MTNEDTLEAKALLIPPIPVFVYAADGTAVMLEELPDEVIQMLGLEFTSMMLKYRQSKNIERITNPAPESSLLIPQEKKVII